MTNDENIETGNFIFSKEISNDGSIISSGKNPVNVIRSDKYSGKGNMEERQTKKENLRWYKKWWMLYMFYPLAVFITGAYLISTFEWK